MFVATKSNEDQLRRLNPGYASRMYLVSTPMKTLVLSEFYSVAPAITEMKKERVEVWEDGDTDVFLQVYIDGGAIGEMYPHG